MEINIEDLDGPGPSQNRSRVPNAGIRPGRNPATNYQRYTNARDNEASQRPRRGRSAHPSARENWRQGPNTDATNVNPVNFPRNRRHGENVTSHHLHGNQEQNRFYGNQNQRRQNAGNRFYGNHNQIEQNVGNRLLGNQNQRNRTFNTQMKTTSMQDLNRSDADVSDAPIRKGQHIGFKFLLELSRSDSNQIISLINKRKTAFLELLQSPIERPDLFTLILKILTTVSNSLCEGLKYNLLLEVCNSQFFTNLRNYLMDLPYTERRSTNSMYWEKPDEFWDNFVSFCDYIMKTIPTIAIYKCRSLIEGTSKCCLEGLSQRQDYNLPQEIASKLDKLRKSLIIREEEGKIVKPTKVSHDEEYEPPENFRQLSVLPQMEDLLNQRPYLRPNIIDGSYENVEHYLDVQFRLLREDCFGPLRDGIHQFLKEPNKKKFDNIRIFRNVKFVHPYISKQKIGSVVQVDKNTTKWFKRINWAHSKRLIYGSLLLFTKDNCKSFIIATVLDRNSKYFYQGKIPISLVDHDIGDALYKNNESYVMIESDVYFEPYFHVLNALQDPMFPEHISMSKYIVHVDTLPNNPSYLSEKSIYKYKNKDDIECTFEVLLEGTWPSNEKMGFNESQYEAYRLALTHEFAVIQGPPGTGKTYLGVNIAKTLINNLSTKRGCILLLICYTNHALDQFLEAITPITKSIVRIGGQSRNESMEAYNLNVLRRFGRRISPETNELFHEYRFKLRRAVVKLQNLQESIDVIGNSVLSFDCIKKYVPESQVIENYYPSSVTNDPLAKWLFENMPYNVDFDQHVNINEEPPENDHIDDDIFNRYDVILDDIVYMDDDVGGEIALSTSFSVIKAQRKLSQLLFTYYINNNYHEKEQMYPEMVVLKSRIKMFQEMSKLRSQEERLDIGLGNPSLYSNEDRWRIYFGWADRVLNEVKELVKPLQDELQMTNSIYEETRMMMDLEILKHVKVIGMTTSGAARLRKLLQGLRPPIVIVEEAAEVLEQHIVTSLTAGCKHLILIDFWPVGTSAKKFFKQVRLIDAAGDKKIGSYLAQRIAIAIQRGNAAMVLGTMPHGHGLSLDCLGDHQQLRPSASHMRLARDYNLEVSLFERMIKNNIHSRRLNVQHRMRPEISALISPHIYPDLLNHHTVESFPNVIGMCNNLFFFTHDYHEEVVDDSSSKANHKEADLVLLLANYLMQQGYSPSDVTILAAYSGQMFYMRNQRERYAHLSKVKITVVDNYQGEESRIILLSLVRNNNDGRIGFLNTENRVCVALSRAREGFYIFGNIDILKKNSDLWVKIAETLEKQGSIGNSLNLRCEVHKNQITTITTAKDFEKVPEGGCLLKCNFNLVHCNHQCPLLCHGYDREHVEIKCPLKCERVICALNHVCPLRCSMPCPSCSEPILKELLCGHSKHLPCALDPTDPSVKCHVQVTITLPHCGHEAKKPCYLDLKLVSCPVYCDARLKCGHVCIRNCHVTDDPDHDNYTCEKPCAKAKNGCSMDIEGDRGAHQCHKQCFQPCEDCEVEVVKKRSNCKHTERIACSKNVDEKPCRKNCARMLECGHFCKKKCYEKCGDCKQQVKKQIPECGHEITIECSRVATREACTQKCERQLVCGHACGGRCAARCDPAACVALSSRVESAPCGHAVRLPCHIVRSVTYDPKILLEHCTEPCNKILACGHLCGGSCARCSQQRLHAPCTQKCNQVLICGHQCEEPCNQICPPCTKQCEVKCNHSKCKNICGETCVPCKEKCSRRCVHGECVRRCGEACSRPACSEPCPGALPCGHRCRGLCGEPCPSICALCNPDDFPKDFLGDDFEDDDKFILLQDCNHVLELENMDNLMFGDKDTIAIRTCPYCRKPIVNTHRYKDFVNSMFKKEINPIKERVYGTREQIKTKNNELKEKVKMITSNPPVIYSDKHWLVKSWCAAFMFLLDKHINKKNKVSLLQLEMQFVYLNILEMLSDTYNLYVSAYLVEFKDEVINLINLICNILMKNVQKISRQQQMDIGNEIKRINSIIQLAKIVSHSSYKSSKEVPQVKEAFKKAKNVVAGWTVYDENEGIIAMNELQKAINVSGIVSKQERELIVRAMGLKAGHWYKCPNGHFYCIGDCGGAMVVAKCIECGVDVGGTSHRLLSTNRHAPEMDGSSFPAWSEEYNNMGNFNLD